jgi:hypothetical protein
MEMDSNGPKVGMDSVGKGVIIGGGVGVDILVEVGVGVEVCTGVDVFVAV